MSNVIKLKNPVSIKSSAAVCGNKEFHGPLRNYFDLHCEDDKFGKETWEKSESEMQRLALNLAITKAQIHPEDINCMFAGDLINQCTSSAFGLSDFNIPFFGLYGACSTIAEALILSSLLVSSNQANTVAAITSSHFCSAERQFRFPLEYGSQRTPTAQWTVTASGAFILSNESSEVPKIVEVLPGRMIDGGINDANNMGAAMTPAVYDTLNRYFQETQQSPENFDKIFTGDLGFEGHELLCELFEKDKVNLRAKHTDCGMIIFNREKQDTHAGGSGCGCGASVLAGFIMQEMKEKKMNNILFLATGALMSPTTVLQGENILGIAHLIHIQNL